MLFQFIYILINLFQIMKKLFFYNSLSRIAFLLLTPTLFRALNFGFIWHSIYWGTITLVVLIWGSMIIISPLFGRIGCGWICFAGTVQDFVSQTSLFKIKWRKPILVLRIIMIILFFASSITFFFINLNAGKISGIQFNPMFLDMEFNAHYKHVWLFDITGFILLGMLLERRWACRNLCWMGAMCAAGASYSRLIPVIDPEKCNLCGKCEKDCLVRIPMVDYVKENHGLVTSSECTLCGKCIESCNQDALKIRFVWNRREYIRNLEMKTG
jgi:ferredoxin-type protein NapH